MSLCRHWSACTCAELFSACSSNSSANACRLASLSDTLYSFSVKISLIACRKLDILSSEARIAASEHSVAT